MFNFKLKKRQKVGIVICIICAIILIITRVTTIYYANKLINASERWDKMLTEVQEQQEDEMASKIDIDNYENPHESKYETSNGIADENETSDSDVGISNEAEDISNEEDEATGNNSSGTNKVSLTFGMWADIYMDARELSFYVANPSKSQKNVSIEFYLDDILLGKSGMIKPGYEIQTVDISEAIEVSADSIAYLFDEESEYEGYMLISYYDPETGVKEKVNTEIPLTMYMN